MTNHERAMRDAAECLIENRGWDHDRAIRAVNRFQHMIKIGRIKCKNAFAVMMAEARESKGIKVSRPRSSR